LEVAVSKTAICKCGKPKYPNARQCLSCAITERNKKRYAALHTEENRRAKFWSQVDKSGGPDACWLWTGPRFHKVSYGRFLWNCNSYIASRVAYELTYGPLPPDLNACHKCDNPPCCNPAHLFPGTNAENQADKKRKGRGAHGERNGTHTHPDRVVRGERHRDAKLTEADILEIRRLGKAGMRQIDIAARFHIGQTHVSRILRRESWTHI
jgi:hypothetical protein